MRAFFFSVYTMSENDSRVEASKRMKYAQLHYELSKLSKSMEVFGRNVNKMNEQAPALLKMNTLHSAM